MRQRRQRPVNAYNAIYEYLLFFPELMAPICSCWWTMWSHTTALPTDAHPTLHHPLQDGKQSVDDVLAAANALLDSMSAGTTPLSMLQASIDELEQMGYVCDESGCVLVDPHDADSMSGAGCAYEHSSCEDHRRPPPPARPRCHHHQPRRAASH